MLPGNNNRLNETIPGGYNINSAGDHGNTPGITNQAWDQTNYVLNHQKVQANKAVRDRGPNV